MISAANFENYRQGDTIQFLNNVLEAIITPARATSFQTVPQRTALQTVMTALTAAWQPEVGSPITPELAGIDSQRDSTFSGFKMTADAWGSNHYDPAMRNAAFIIADNIAAHGKEIIKMRYQQQTATLYAILNDLNGPLSVHVATLGLQGWVDKIRELNDAFNEKYLERNQATAGNDPGAIATMITDAILKYRMMKDMFDARHAVAVADSAPVIDAFVTAEQEWNNLIRKYNDEVQHNSGGGDDDNDEQPEGGDTEPPTPDA